jgi:hypothetical protein
MIPSPSLNVRFSADRYPPYCLAYRSSCPTSAAAEPVTVRAAVPNIKGTVPIGSAILPRKETRVDPRAGEARRVQPARPMALVGANLAGESGENVHDHRRPRLMPTNLGVLEAIGLLFGNEKISTSSGAANRSSLRGSIAQATLSIADRAEGTCVAVTAEAQSGVLGAAVRDRAERQRVPSGRRTLAPATAFPPRNKG